MGWRELSWQAGYACFQGLFFCESLSQQVLVGARGKIAVVSHSIQRVTALLIPVIKVSLAYTDALVQEWGFPGKGQMGQCFAPAWWLEISSNTDIG